MQNQPKPPLELQQLNFLIGNWNTEGQVLATPGNPSVTIKGTDTYEWVTEGFFVLHRVDVLIGNEKVEVVEIIGSYDPQNKIYAMHSFDNKGEHTAMFASIESGVMTITGNMMRATLSASGDGRQMTAKWERSEDGLAWKPWIDMRFSK